jgi:hypothetical protein
MTLTTLLTLAGLALVDSTSFGTLGIPLVLVVAAKRVQVRPLGIYFGTVVVFYFAVGVLLLLGLGAAFDALGDALDSEPVSWAQLVLGVGLLALSFRFDGKRSKGKPRRNWVPSTSSDRAMFGVALTATLLEVATMLPYLGAIGLLSTSDIGWAQRILILAVYCVVMILPALMIFGVAMLFGERLWPLMERLSNWIQRNSEGTIGWIIGIAGFLLAANAAGKLGLIG